MECKKLIYILKSLRLWQDRFEQNFPKTTERFTKARAWAKKGENQGPKGDETLERHCRKARDKTKR